MLRGILKPEGDIRIKSATRLFEGGIIYCRDTLIRPYFRLEALFVAVKTETPVFELCYGAIRLDRAVDLRTNEDILKDIEISDRLFDEVSDETSGETSDEISHETSEDM